MKNIIGNKIHPVYFSCGRHFNYLFISLVSLEKVHSKYIGKVYIYSDKDNPLTISQESALVKIKLDINLRNGDSFAGGYGKQAVLTELKAFREVEKELAPGDYIARVDSDTVFISDSVFNRVLESNALFVGQKFTYWKPVIFQEGALYFLKKEIIPQIENPDDNELSQLLSQNNKAIKKKTGKVLAECGDDVIIYNLVRHKTDKIKFIDFFIPLKSLRFKRKYSVLHYGGPEKDKFLRVLEPMNTVAWENYRTRLKTLYKMYPEIRPTAIVVTKIRELVECLFSFLKNRENY